MRYERESKLPIKVSDLDVGSGFTRGLHLLHNPIQFDDIVCYRSRGPEYCYFYIKSKDSVRSRLVVPIEARCISKSLGPSKT